MVPQGFLGIPQEGKGIPFLGVSEKRKGGKGTQSLGVTGGLAHVHSEATVKGFYKNQ